MDKPVNSLREEFIMELLAFSPKYNSDLAGKIADQLTQEQLVDSLEKLRRINAFEQKRLDDLAERDPAAYDQEVKLWEETAQKSDDDYFGELEKDLVEESNEIDAVFSQHEKEVDEEEKKAMDEINKGYDEADQLLKTFFEELEKQETAPTDGTQSQSNPQ